jgi:DHA2 family multidrug resistance protein-like MFS transporter
VTAGVALGGAFVWRQLTVTDPLVNLRLFRVPAFSAALATNLIAFFVVFGMSLFVTQYLQSVLGLSPLQAGLWSVPEALGFIAGSTVTPRLAGRVTTSAVIVGGLIVGAAGYLITAGANGTLAPVVAGTTLAAFGLGAVITLTADAAVGTAPADQAGVASATAETSSELGGALGIAVLGSIGSAVYRAQIADSLPSNFGQAARETIGGALAAAQHLRPTVGDQRSAAAQQAFGHALTVTASIGGVLLLATGAAALALLRRDHASSGVDVPPVSQDAIGDLLPAGTPT